MTKTTYPKSLYVIISIGVALIALIIGLYAFSANKPGEYDEFAKCISNSGAVFYGAFWCPHCQNQKKMFGSSAKYLPYVECSTPNGQNQTQYCINQDIEGYPTWTFKDGSKLSGEISLSTLAEKTNCSIYPNTEESQLLPPLNASTSTTTSTQQ